MDAGRQLVDVEESGASSSAEVNIITPQPSEQSEIQQSEVETVSSQITIDAADRPAPMVLPNYKRTAATPGHCIYPNCVSEERLRVPKPMRLRLLSDFKLYVPNSARVCVEHIRLYNWEEVVQQNEFMLTFTSEQIEDMLNLLSNIRSAFKLDFENVESWSHHLCHYWLGHSPEEILQIINGCSSFRTVRNAKTIVSIYLLKLRTGDSNERLGTLLQMPVTTIGRYLKKAREILCREFVPQHLGLECLTRDNLLRKNLIIPKGLFGDDSNSKAIVIADATYVYIQKSSNYYFQKKTYSLHKYRNLIKPFLIVASNGHILDVWGPYSATISDATIMKDLFAEENGPLRRYFREGDVFILDRGFRDAMDDLVRYNYEPHKPESLEEGQTQLPTIHANKSRCVTICRWVIEVINGKFKRDYKLLRQTYFNNTCRNVMTDFRIAAALVNVFHKLITDRTDAPAILSQIRARMDVPNQLCDFIEDYNVNRRRAAFTPINGDLPQLSMFPMLTMENLILFALGTYQIKQARLYYGEHMRQNGSYSIDVCENIERIGNITDDSYFDVNELLIRAKIQSRHHTGKTYFVYILLGQPSDTVDNPINLIKSYYCNCIVGKRTVGCCAHTMTVVWFLGWARHRNVNAPATFLDGILIREDIENE